MFRTSAGVRCSRKRNVKL